MSNILIVWSNYYPDLAQKQLETCLSKLKHYDYRYQIETVEAGTYEIPAVIQHYHCVQPFDGYLPLSLLLKGSTDHYEFIWEHVKACFIQFALAGLTLGNGIISAIKRPDVLKRSLRGCELPEAIFAFVNHGLLRLQLAKTKGVFQQLGPY